MTAAADFRPVYQRELDDLRNQITSGQLAPGDALPSEEELAQHYDISRSSVRGAIRALRDSGLVEVHRPRGTFVRTPPIRTVRAPTERYQWEKNRARLPLAERDQTGTSERESGLEKDELDFHATYERQSASEQVASKLGVEPGTEVLQRIYETRRKTTQAVIGCSRSYLPTRLIESNPDLFDASNEPWPGATSHQLYTVGIEIDTITDSVTTRMPTVDEKSLMRLVDGTPVFEIQKISTSTTGTVVEVSIIVLPGDRAELQYTIQLQRWE